MKRLMSWKKLAAMAAALGAVACSSDATGPADKTEGELVFARFDASSQVHSSFASFWAVKGQDRRLEMRYPAAAGQVEGEEFLEFRVKPNSLLLKPDHTPYLPGDSVLITVTADPNQRFIFTFQPSGLTFSPAEPAELRIRYNRADPDVDHDGDRDSVDAALLQQLKVWQQELPGLPWLLVPSLRVDSNSEVRGTVTHFTAFSLAT